MMKKFLATTALVLGCWTGSAQAAAFVSFNAGSGTPATGSTVIQNFESFANNTPIGPNAFATSNSTNLTFRPAFGSTGNFGAVLDGGNYSLTFAPTNLFSFALGSLDTFNRLTLSFADGSTQVLNGGQIINDPLFDNGNRTSAETNGTAFYSVTSGPLLTGATFFSSGGNSFEFDNLAVGGTIPAVPEPAAWGMMILGFGLVGGVLRRRPSTTVKFA